MPDETLPLSWLDWLVKTLLGVFGGLLGWAVKDTRKEIAEMRKRMEMQEQALAVLRSDINGQQALMLDKMEGVETKIEGMSHVLGTMSETLTQLRIDQTRRGG